MTEITQPLDFSATETIIEDANGEVIQEKQAKRPVGRPKKSKPVQKEEEQPGEELNAHKIEITDEGDFAEHFMEAIYCQGLVHGMVVTSLSFFTGYVLHKMLTQ